MLTIQRLAVSGFLTIQSILSSDNMLPVTWYAHPLPQGDPRSRFMNVVLTPSSTAMHLSIVREQCLPLTCG